MDSSKIKKRLEGLKTERKSVETIWELLEKFVVPFRSEFYKDGKDENEINWKKRDIYDSTAPNSAEALASSIHSNLTSPVVKWFETTVKLRGRELSNDEKIAIDDLENLLWTQIITSNFDLKIGEMYTDLTGFDNAFFTIEYDKDKQPYFDALPLKECYFELDSRGGISLFIRDLYQTYGQLEDRFGELPDEVEEKIKERTDKGERIRVIFAIYPNEDHDEETFDNTMPASDSKKPYNYKWILEDGTEISSGGYYDMPVFFVPWKRTASSKFGNGPATRSLPNVLTLNEIVEQMLEGTAKSIDPPIFTTKKNAISDIDLSRGGITIVRDPNELKEWVTNARLDVGAAQIQDFRTSIRETFHIDQLQLKDSPAMTATEVTVRYELMQRLIGPTLGRIQVHVLDKVINSMIMNAIRTKEWIIPESLQGESIRIQYTGPMPKAQRIKEAMGIQEWLRSISELAGIFPEVKDIPDIDEAARLLAELQNVPAKIVKDETDIKMGRKNRQDGESQMAAAQTANQASQASLNMAKATQVSNE